MGIMPELRWMVVDNGRSMYSKRRFMDNNDLTTLLSVGVGRTISHFVGLCQVSEPTTRPSWHHRIFL